MLRSRSSYSSVSPASTHPPFRSRTLVIAINRQSGWRGDAHINVALFAGVDQSGSGDCSARGYVDEGLAAVNRGQDGEASRDARRADDEISGNRAGIGQCVDEPNGSGIGRHAIGGAKVTQDPREVIVIAGWTCGGWSPKWANQRRREHTADSDYGDIGTAARIPVVSAPLRRIGDLDAGRRIVVDPDLKGDYGVGSGGKRAAARGRGARAGVNVDLAVERRVREIIDLIIALRIGLRSGIGP